MTLATVLVATMGSAAAAATPPSANPTTVANFLEALHGVQADPHPADEAPAAFASVSGRELMLPGTVRTVGFHESGDPRSLAMSPLGRAEANLNAPRISLPAVNGDSDTGYVVLPTRYRQGGPTTAVDISMTRGEPVTSPVSGTVTAVSSYLLYTDTPDKIVEIAPAGQPDLRVRMLHIEDVQVQVDQQVQAGETVIARSARPLPFDSQIDRLAGSHPHVHIDVHHRP